MYINTRLAHTDNTFIKKTGDNKLKKPLRYYEKTRSVGVRCPLYPVAAKEQLFTYRTPYQVITRHHRKESCNVY